MSKPPKKFQDGHDPGFSVLARQVANAIEKNKDGTATKEQFEELVEAETLFKKSVMEYKIAGEIYKRFIQLIRIKNKNILSARPYFRENSKTFSHRITPALKASNPEALMEFGINFHFIKFCKDNWVGLWPRKLELIYNRTEKARTILIENNLPLAINRAKLFFRKTPKNHLSFMDMIETCSMGLCAGIDKYTGTFKKNFMGVCIGRMVGNLIDIYSETLVHFYPNDKRTIYRANSIKGRQGITDIEELTKAVNESFKLDLEQGNTAPKPTTVSELSYLLAAASLVSADSNSGEEGYGVYDYTPDESENSEEIFAKKQQFQYMGSLARKLPILNRKILKLKGVDF